MSTLNFPKKTYVRTGAMQEALKELGEEYQCKRALIVSDPELHQDGAVEMAKRCLHYQGIQTAEVYAVVGIPTEADLRKSLAEAQAFSPDWIAGVGGGRAMNTAKLLWALYEHPEMNLEEAAAHPESVAAGEKTRLILAATSFGSGGQNTPFALFQGEGGTPCILRSDVLLPEISVTDAFFMESLPPVQIRRSALGTLSLAIHAYGDERSCKETRDALREAIMLILNHLYEAEDGDSEAREKIHYAAALAGAAFGSVWTDLDGGVEEAKTEEEKQQLKARIEQLAKELGYEDAEDFWLVCGNLR